MNKEEIEGAFETDFTNPGSLKSGEYLAEHVLQRAKRLVQDERAGLIEMLRSWIQQRTLPRTLLALEVAGELNLTELRTHIESLGRAIRSGECFLPYYVSYVDRALSMMEE